jgi:hypothetical protein
VQYRAIFDIRVSPVLEKKRGYFLVHGYHSVEQWSHMIAVALIHVSAA